MKIYDLEERDRWQRALEQDRKARAKRLDEGSCPSFFPKPAARKRVSRAGHE